MRMVQLTTVPTEGVYPWSNYEPVKENGVGNEEPFRMTLPRVTIISCVVCDNDPRGQDTDELRPSGVWYRHGRAESNVLTDSTWTRGLFRPPSSRSIGENPGQFERSVFRE
ncbi:hypothetical protein SODALDRAFT_221443 [Sodiomyces alkalinus F11]|uniref:Uncharacterized protein n=1 Tax=Sodiomyces alkalinus (strain CBS 110278 / VKM F-3762 / F11) TaxID=1314773 RepID=A0A3N2PPV1_SODAK|nr:hypothetical protein SODALDRAFT_221443 [Sodiomyces alkalinus F11]ROT36531.1 hypothetical protein SODALDRAFT_221443 [Sodiomyces alkalinus F11]